MFVLLAVVTEEQGSSKLGSVGTKCAQTNVHINVQINKKKSQTKKEEKEM